MSHWFDDLACAVATQRPGRSRRRGATLTGDADAFGPPLSRRQVVRAFAAGAAAATPIATWRPTLVAAGAVGCNSDAIKQCQAQAKTQRDAYIRVCGEGPEAPQEYQHIGGAIDFSCKLLVDRAYFQRLADCDPCSPGYCLDGKCCPENKNCCAATGRKHCFEHSFPSDENYCCAPDEGCCSGLCCKPEEDCCVKTDVDMRRILGQVVKLSNYCANLKNDPKNCGSCGNECALRQICNDGVCECPKPLKECGFGAFQGGCCGPCQRCAINAFGIVYCEPDQCDDPCFPCDPDSRSCEPLSCLSACLKCVNGACVPKCPPNQQCDPNTGQCLAPLRYYCACNGVTYDDRNLCQSECRVSLGCFVGICGPV